MLQRLSIPGAYFWSQWDARLGLPANGFFLSTSAGNAIVDPLPLEEADHARIAELGGVAKIIVISPHRLDEARRVAHRYDAELVQAPEHREELLSGIHAIRLQHQPSRDAFYLTLQDERAVLVGDWLVGAPAGDLSLLPDGEYADVRIAALALRTVLRANPDAILAGHGQSLFTGAYDVLYRMLLARAGPEVHRINVDELDYRDERDERDEQPDAYQNLDAEVGFAIGARKLGYRVNVVAPGHRFCPMHSHAREEELFYVIDGEPSVRMESGTFRCRKGDFIALPVGNTGLHQLLNESSQPATVLLLARAEDMDSCYYPDSDKILVDWPVPMSTGRNRSILVRATPELDYFDGE